MVPCSNHGRVIFTQGIYKGLKPWETNINNFNTSTCNNDQVNNSSEISKNYDEKITKSITFNDNLLKKYYFLESANILKYLKLKFSASYSQEMSNTLKEIFSRLGAENPNDIKRLIEEKRINERRAKTAYRVFLNYLEDRELLEEEVLYKYRRKIKLNIQTNFDTYVPTKESVNSSIENIAKYSNEYKVLYKLILESGCRPSELKEFILNFDANKVEVHESIVIYRNFYLRKSKNSYYLFFTRKTFDEFLSLNKKFELKDYNSFKERVVRFNKEYVGLKYLRKYQFTLLIKAGVDFEIANFIQGRSSKNIGFNHYLAKKEVGIREYMKVVDMF